MKNAPDRRPVKNRSGSAAVEMAIVLPLVLLFIIGLTEFGRAIWIKATLDYAVEAAARCAVINTTVCGSAAQVQSYAVSRSPGLTLNASTFTLTAGTCGMQVSASLPFQFVAPSLFPLALTFTSTACYPT